MPPLIKNVMIFLRDVLLKGKVVYLHNHVHLSKVPSNPVQCSRLLINHVKVQLQLPSPPVLLCNVMKLPTIMKLMNYVTHLRKDV